MTCSWGRTPWARSEAEADPAELRQPCRAAGEGPLARAPGGVAGGIACRLLMTCDGSYGVPGGDRGPCSAASGCGFAPPCRASRHRPGGGVDRVVGVIGRVGDVVNQLLVLLVFAIWFLMNHHYLFTQPP